MFTMIQFLFPITDESIHDLSFVNFSQHVLLPESTILLAQADIHVSHEKAIEIMQASQQYGMMMHPEDESNDGEEYCVMVQKRHGKSKVKVEVEEKTIDLSMPEEVGF
jgi:hypothetical protein